MKQILLKRWMPRNLKPLFLTQNCQSQLQMRRPTLRYPVKTTLQIVIQRNNTLPEPSPKPVEESTDLLTEYQQVMRLMTLGTMILILMSVTTCTHTHTQIVPLLILRPWNNRPHRGLRFRNVFVFFAQCVVPSLL